MFKHLKGTHPELLKLYLQHKNWIELRRKENRSNQKSKNIGDGTKQLLLESSDKKQLFIQKPQIDHQLQEKFDTALTLYGAQNYLSFRALANIGPVLKATCRGPLKVKVKSYKSLAKMSTELCQKLKFDMQGIIDLIKVDSNSWAFTSDVWSGQNMDSFLSLTVHVITEDFNLVKLVPFVRVFNESHTGRAIQLRLDEYVEELGGLASNLIRRTIVLDNASPNKLAIKLSDLFDAWFCIIHTCLLYTSDAADE